MKKFFTVVVAVMVLGLAVVAAKVAVGMVAGTILKMMYVTAAVGGLMVVGAVGLKLRRR